MKSCTIFFRARIRARFFSWFRTLDYSTDLDWLNLGTVLIYKLWKVSIWEQRLETNGWDRACFHRIVQFVTKDLKGWFQSYNRQNLIVWFYNSNSASHGVARCRTVSHFIRTKLGTNVKKKNMDQKKNFWLNNEKHFSIVLIFFVYVYHLRISSLLLD